ncbi:MAG: rhamnulose-1-phosphate aldolase [Pseudobutyrivibrio sp.]|nr:rhamnulose-1-phosphate aldolase [Pseudobutyrivibrio sp.]
MGTIFNERVIEDFMLMCKKGVDQGWHERNGGNLSYRMTKDDVEYCARFFKKHPGEWVEMPVSANNLKGEFFIVTGSGKFLENVNTEPQNNIAIVEINQTGNSYRIVWGLDQGGKPTSEFPTHFLTHSARKMATDGDNRVIYHAHTPYVVALTNVLPLESELFTRMLWKSATECCLFCPGGVGVVPWMVPGSTEIAECTSDLLSKYDAAIWAFHGAFVTGKDFDSAFGLMQTIEKSAMVATITLAANAGKMPNQTITDDQLREMAKAYNIRLNEDFLK